MSAAAAAPSADASVRRHADLQTGADAGSDTGAGSDVRSDVDTSVLLDLTDEELFALDGPEQGVVVLPYLHRIGPEDRETVRSVAVRGLFARGILRSSSEAVDFAGRAAAEGERIVAVRDDVAEILLRRRSPVAVLAAQRVTAGPGGPETLMRYVFDGGADLLVEDVSESGIHRFTRATIAALAPVLAEFLAVAPSAVPGAQAAVAPPRAWPTHFVPRDDGAAILADVHLVAEFVVRRDDHPATSTYAAYVFPDLAYTGRAPVDDPAAARLSRVDPSTLGQWAAELLFPPTVLHGPRGLGESSA